MGGVNTACCLYSHLVICATELRWVEQTFAFQNPEVTSGIIFQVFICFWFIAVTFLSFFEIQPVR